LNQQFYKKLVSGQTKGFCPSAVRAALTCVSAGYCLIINARNKLYTSRILKAQKAKAPVISIGNITAGGTGKTPIVIWLCNYLAQKNLKPAVLTRGYKTDSQTPKTDEPALIEQSCPGCSVIINPDRVQGAHVAVSEHDAQIIIMDDGFQHRRLARDIDVLAIDATEPFGYGKVLPAGMLREPASSIKRAHAVILTRCDQAEPQKLEAVKQKIKQLNKNIIIAESLHEPQCIIINKAEQKFDYIKDKKIFAFCAIGNPDSFYKTLSAQQADIVGTETFDDHHNYNPADIDMVLQKAAQLNAQLVLTTEKDWTKLHDMPVKGDIELGFVKIKIHFTLGLDEFTHLIDSQITSTITGAKKHAVND